MKSHVLVTVVLSVLPLISANNVLLPGETTTSGEELATITVNNGNFSRNFFKALDSSGNVVSSPLSAWLVLAMTQLGAKFETLAELNSALNLPADRAVMKQGMKDLITNLRVSNNEDITLRIANRMYLKSGATIKTDFIQAVNDTFDAAPLAVDFTNPRLIDDINEWVEQETAGKIKDIVSPGQFNGKTSLVLLNAAYLKAKWLNYFDAKLTTDMTFYPSGDQSGVEVPFMRNDDLNVARGFNSRLQATFVELPYKSPGRNTHMLLVMPVNRTGLSELEDKMAAEDLNELVRSLTSGPLKLKLPKFKIESTLSLNDPLKRMGLDRIFTNRAQFPDIAQLEANFISEIKQKCFIQVDETSTEAAAVTGTHIRAPSVPRPPEQPLDVKFDHPFLFYITHVTVTQPNRRVVLFSGRVTRPQLV